MQLETERLILRRPEERDFEGFCELMTDEVASTHIGGVAEPPMIWRNLAMLIGHWEMRGYGFFSVIDKASRDWVGRVGPWRPHAWPDTEVGWSIARRFWGRGFGPEAARASIDYAFEQLGWTRVIHLIAKDNVNSQAVARKLGSVNTKETVIVPGLGMETEVWAQTREHWTEARRED